MKRVFTFDQFDAIVLFVIIIAILYSIVATVKLYLHTERATE